ncbi:MAG: hypothetical protein ACREVX_06020 [Clostridium sp.]|uniref:hypothetical protein n=1 Tax=Clostridium sp. TaxID=1506 RepID=UPI003D6CCACA
MFISPPNNFNQSSTTSMPKFGMNDDERENPMPGDSASTQSYEIAPGSPIVNNPLYNQGWLQGKIGKYMRVAFLLGTNTIQDRTGTLQEVGISFIVLKEPSTDNLIMCDIYSIKFVTVFDNQTTTCPL